ncbi:MAG: DUF3995 domain-containing protein [candidate division Zixibacteria bacterium]|nr:DUF3995 domain-containing protein [candidate division Zixibacteria bacterium]
MSKPGTFQPRWVHYAAAIRALGFAAPHIWWAFGISAGFPGGVASYHRFMGSLWRYLYDIFVILLSIAAFFVALAPIRSWGRGIPPWILRTAAWIACGMLSLRGVAGMLVDGTSDLVRWPIFLTGGILFGWVAWLSRRSKARPA